MKHKRQRVPVKKRKALGQHFLRSAAALAKIVASADIKCGDRILEVGPGEGVLTEALLQKGAKVIAVEKDARLITKLNERLAQYQQNGSLFLFRGDILDPVLQQNIFLHHILPAQPYKVVANIPYYITGALFRLFLQQQPQPNTIVFLVQKEVAQEIIARNKKEGVLSLSIKIYGDPEIVGRVPRGAFAPPPKVDSAIIRVTRISRERLQGLQDEEFFRVVRAGLGAKRKKLIGNLMNTLHIPKATLLEHFARLHIPTSIRGEDLPLSMWVALARALRKNESSGKLSQ